MYQGRKTNDYIQCRDHVRALAAKKLKRQKAKILLLIATVGCYSWELLKNIYIILMPHA